MLLNKHWYNATLSDVVTTYTTSDYLIWPSLFLSLRHMACPSSVQAKEDQVREVKEHTLVTPKQEFKLTALTKILD